MEAWNRRLFGYKTTGLLHKTKHNKTRQKQENSMVTASGTCEERRVKEFFPLLRCGSVVYYNPKEYRVWEVQKEGCSVDS